MKTKNSALRMVQRSLIFGGIAVALASCETSGGVSVTNSRTGRPVGGAAVTGHNGNLVSSPTYTDAAGLAALPAMPVPILTLKVSKAGYNTASTPMPIVITSP